MVCTRALARLYGWDCWVAPPTCELILCLWCQLWAKCSLMVSVSLRFMQVFSCSWKRFHTPVFFSSSFFWKKGERDKDTMLTSFFFHIWFDVCLWGSQLWRCTLFAVVNARWTTSNQKLLVMEPQWIKNTESAKRLLIPPVYSSRGTRAYDKLQIVVTEVGQVKQTFTVPLQKQKGKAVSCWCRHGHLKV